MKMKTIVFVSVVVLAYCWQTQAQICTGFTSTTPDTTTFIDDVSTTGGVSNISNLGSGLDSGNPTIKYVNSFNTMTVSTYPGGTFAFNVAVQGVTVGCAIWVDWDGDDTLEMSEVVFHTTSYGNGPFTGTVLTPSGTTDGDYVMRIMIDYHDPNPDDDPCAFELDSSRGEVEDYKVTVDASLAPACLAPTVLSASNIGDTTADLGWTENGTATVWDIEIVDITASGAATGTPTATGVSNPYTATGLSSVNDYEYYVRADCGTTDGVSAWAGPFAFRTLCTTTVAPYSEGFETFTVSTAGLSSENCWTATNMDFYFWEVAATTNSSDGTGPGPGVSNGNYVFTEATEGSSGDAIDLVSPLVDLSGLTAPALSFDYHMYGRDMGTLQVIVSSGGTDTTVLTLTGEQQTSASDPFLTGFIDLNAYSGQTIKVIFRGTRGADFLSNMAIDNVVFDALPACPQPFALGAANITTNAADLSWTEVGTATSWDIEIVDITASGTATGTPTATGVSNPYTATGLSSANAYAYYVRADCGTTDGVSAWAGPFAFRTLCTPTMAPYTEGFETFTVSSTGLSSENCWTATNIDDYVWEVAATTDAPLDGTGPGTGVSDGNYVFTEASEASSGDAIDLVSPSVDLSGLTAPALSFDYHMYGEDMGTLQVIVSSGGTDTTVLTLTGEQQVTGSVPFFTRFIDLNAYSGQTIKVTFRGTRGAGVRSDMAIDNVVFDALPACPQPFALGAANITTNAADLSWTEAGTATVWDIELVDVTASGTATGTPTASGVSNPYTATGLGSANDYAFYVRANCGVDGASPWVGPFVFSTLCNNDTATPPFTENFDASTSLGCGTIVNDGSGNIWEMTTFTSSGFTANHLRYKWNGSNAANTWYFTQGLNLTGGTSYTLSYDYGGGLGSIFDSESLRVSYGTAANSGAMTTVLANYPSITSATPTSDSVVFTPPADGVYYIGFQAYSIANQFFLHLDNITVDFTLSAPDLANSEAFTYYPNPVGNTLTLKAQNTIETLTVYNMLGQEVLRAQPNRVDSTVDMSGLANGAYFVKVTMANTTKTIRVIKQ